MRTIAMIAGLALSVAALPAAADAACQKRTNGTIIGAVAGGLLGHTVAGRGDHTEGALLGAAAGGLVGNQVSKCNNRRTAYRAPARSYRSASSERVRYASACRTENRAYYDAYGRVVYQPTQICR